MVELSQRDRTIHAKIVYYGPAVGGKTTNLQVLHQHAARARRGELLSVTSGQDRTILFDLLPLRTTGLRGFDLRIQVLAVPGQAVYSATRRLVLKGVDALVFVANSAADRWEDNVTSFREMTENLIAHQLDPSSLPLVLQYNKRDLPEVTPFEFMDRTLNARKVEAFPAVAVRGEGVLETFSAVLSRTVADLSRRYRILDATRGTQTLERWTEQTMIGLFGTTSLYAVGGPAADVPPVETRSPAARAAAPPERRPLRIELPEDAVRRAGMTPDARANETLVNSYAQAAERLGLDLATVREERDVARQRLVEMRQALLAAQEILAGRPLDAALPAVLAAMATTGGSSHASFLVPAADAGLRPAALRNLAEDPLLRSRPGLRFATERLLQAREPVVHQAADTLDLGAALTAQTPVFAAVAAVPVRTPRDLHALAMLYYAPDDALPGADVLDHLAGLAGAVSASLELGRALETAQQAERNLQMALVGQAALEGIEVALMSMLVVRDRLGALRQRADAPPWLHEELTRLTPCLVDALGTGRSLFAFGRGEIEKEPIALDELVGELRSAGVDVQVAEGLSRVWGDPVLVRMAVLALLEHARAENAGHGRLFVAPEGGGTKLRVGLGSAATEDTHSLRFAGPNMRLAFVQKVAQLHGGHLGTEVDSAGQLWATLELPGG